MFIEGLARDPVNYLVLAMIIIVSICLHELAHGIVAVWLGDDTPIREGHMTLNPLVHMGPMSLVVLLIAGIAWGQMPVREERLRGRFGMALVSAAGPAMNALLALLSLVSLGIWMRYQRAANVNPSNVASNAWLLLYHIGALNILLGIFNLIPVPPLDGSNIVRSLNPSLRNAMQALRQAPFVFFGVFMIAGYFIQPWSEHIALRILKAVIGFRVHSGR